MKNICVMLSVAANISSESFVPFFFNLTRSMVHKEGEREREEEKLRRDKTRQFLRYISKFKERLKSN